MAGRGEIRAGKAFVELSLKDNLTKGLKNASQKLKDFGGGVATVGAGVAALGTGIVAPLLAAASRFADVGSALNDMSARTGVSAQALTELGHAADMTGATMEGVEKGI